MSLSITLGPASWCLLVADDMEILGPITGGATSGPSGRAPRASRPSVRGVGDSEHLIYWMNRATNVSGGERSSERKHHDRPAN